MDELRESSLLFSLESLLETERERVQREAREAQRKREDELARVAEMAERRRLAAQQEREARERRQALEQERERMDQERLDAMKRAVVERARVEVEGNARLVEAEQARKHELSLADLRGRHHAARYRALTWLSSGVLVLSWGGALFAYFGLIEPAHAGREQHLQSLIAADAELAKISERALSLERSKNQALQARVDQLSSAPTPPAAAQPSPPKPPSAVHGGGGGPKPPVVRPPRECVDNGDPLNAQLCHAKRAR
jgi:hypothetical protein